MMNVLTKEHKSLLIMGAIGSVAAIVALGYAGKKAKAVANAINPVNQNNIFYSATNAVGEKITGKSDFTLGGWVYDITHDDGGGV